MSHKKWVIGTLGTIILGCLSCGFLLPCVQQVRNGDYSTYSRASLNVVAEAMQGYYADHGTLPPAVVRDKAGNPLYSWRVLLLPYLEEDILYSQFHLDEAWDSPHNKTFLEKTPRPYVPRFYNPDPDGLTRHQVLIGPGTAFERDGLTWDDFSDNRSETIMVVEAEELVPWSKPADLQYDPNGPLPVLGGRYSKTTRHLCYWFVSHPGFNAAFAHGRGRFVRSDSDENAIRALITRNGGEKVGLVFVD